MLLWKELGDSNILIVEDDPFNRLLIKSMFDKIPQVSFYEAGNGLEALEELSEQKMDLVLLDIHMPFMNGYETLVEIKKNKEYNHMAIVAITTDEDQKHRFLSKGTDDFISKPFKIEDLERKIYHSLKNKKEITRQIVETDQRKQKENAANKDMYHSVEIESKQKDFFLNLISLRTNANSQTREKVKIVSSIAKVFAEKLSYSKKEVADIYYSALIRDIGLIGFCDVLDAHTKFSNEEKEKRNEYIMLGHQLLAHSIKTDFTATAKNIILQYNERHDGSGVPNGLKGAEISDEANIVSIAETFEALLTDLKYRKRNAFTPVEAYKIMLSESGKKFNPNLLEKFFEHFSEFILLREELLANKDLRIKNQNHTEGI